MEQAYPPHRTRTNEARAESRPGVAESHAVYQGTLNDGPIWRNPPPGRLIGKGHPIGDFLHAHEWELLEYRPGYFRIAADLPKEVRNLRGELFGGFSPTYVDLASLRCVSASRPAAEPRRRLVTVNMRIDYFEPVIGPRFFVECEVRNQRGRNYLVETRFRDGAARLLLFAITTIRATEVAETVP
jgi:acyl-coenzyme A thioesterase PaaI-like protein